MLSSFSVVVALVWASVPVEPQADDLPGFVGVAAATDANVAVAWTHGRIWSLDGSRTFLDGAERVRAVAVAPDGTLYTIRGQSRLGAVKPGGETEWHRAPLAGETRGLQVFGDRLAWIVDRELALTQDEGRSRKLALTQDEGRSWTVQDLPADADHGRLRFLPDGAIDLLAYVENCHSGDYTVRYRGRVDSNEWQKTGTGADTEFDGEPHFGSGGLARVTLVSRHGWTFSLDTASSGSGERLIRSGPKGHITVLDEDVPEDLELHAVDHLGRVLGLSSGRVWRWSTRGRWQTIGGQGRIRHRDAR